MLLSRYPADATVTKFPDLPIRTIHSSYLILLLYIFSVLYTCQSSHTLIQRTHHMHAIHHIHNIYSIHDTYAIHAVHDIHGIHFLGISWHSSYQFTILMFSIWPTRSTLFMLSILSIQTVFIRPMLNILSIPLLSSILSIQAVPCVLLVSAYHSADPCDPTLA